jgi:hypothetical protein
MSSPEMPIPVPKTNMLIPFATFLVILAIAGGGYALFNTNCQLVELKNTVVQHTRTLEQAVVEEEEPHTD